MRFLKHGVYLFLLLMAFSSFAATKHINIVKPVVVAFKAGDKAAIAGRVHYPLQRKAPLQAIETQVQLSA